jgi:hypothetical protein
MAMPGTRGLVRLVVEGLGEEVWLVDNPGEVRAAWRAACARWDSQELWDDAGALGREPPPPGGAAGAARGRVVLRGHAGHDIPAGRDEAWLGSVTAGCDKATADEVRALAEGWWAEG